jgi:hypothetical protein
VAPAQSKKTVLVSSKGMDEIAYLGTTVLRRLCLVAREEADSSWFELSGEVGDHQEVYHRRNF